VEAKVFGDENVDPKEGIDGNISSFYDLFILENGN
jgi:hypothetical protein